jgi:Fe-S-cluster containining protein
MENSNGDSIMGKHGLEAPDAKPLGLWSDADFENVLDACRKENMSPRLPLLFNPANIERLLRKSSCRGCGICCGWGPGSAQEAGPGVFLFEDELEKLGNHPGCSGSRLNEKVIRDERLPGAWYLPFPCIFRSGERCRVYEARPFACRTFPLANYQLNGKYYIAVNVQCRYGAEIYKSVVKELSAGKTGADPIRYET